jgi:hypothetical protein
MDCEVSTLMGAADEELWERAGLLSLVDELCMNKQSRCQLNDSIITPPTNSVNFPKHLISGTKPYHQHSRVLEISKGQDTTSLSGEVPVSLSFDCCGQLKGHQVDRNKFEVLTTPIFTQVVEFQGGHTQCKRGFPKCTTRCGNQRILNEGWFWEWMWDSKNHETSLFVL